MSDVEPQGQPGGSEEPVPVVVSAGMACTDLLADPQAWIRRRVETVELLSYEETRRRVSVDFSLPDDVLDELTVEDGVVVPIAVLTKEPRRHFDLRDEGGRSIPVLGKEQNGELALIALMNAVLNALSTTPSEDALEMLVADMRLVVQGALPDASDALAYLIGAAEGGDALRAAVWADPTCRFLLGALWQNYVLFAILPEGGPNRRVLKYGYGDDFNPTTEWLSRRQRLAPRYLAWRLWKPDHQRFVILTPGAGWASSFHVEVAVPHELRITQAMLYDFASDEAVGAIEKDVDRASLYASAQLTPEHDVDAYVEVAPERSGNAFQWATTSIVVTALLWLGVSSGLDATNPGAAVSLLLAGAALFSGLSAAQGQHRILKHVFRAPRRWLALVSVSALFGSATLAMEIPDQSPVDLWRWAAIASSVAAARLAWSAIRAPS